MTAESQRDLITAVRKVVFAGVVIMLAWLLLLGFRGVITVDAINQLNTQMQSNSESHIQIPLNTWSWNWSKSLLSDRTVSQVVSPRLGYTLTYIVFTMFFSMLFALAFLFLGRLISRAANRPPWLVNTLGILRILIICFGVSIPVFAWETLAVVYPALWWHLPVNSAPAILFISISASLLPAWLLVQYGQGEIANWPETLSKFDSALWRHLSIRLAIKSLKQVGVILVISMFLALTTPLAGFPRLLIDSVNRQDFPLIFGIAWACVIIVVLFKLAADLLEIAYSHFWHPPASTDDTSSPSRTFVVPKWLIFTALGLVAVSLIIAVAAPLIAPHPYNEMTLTARLQAPSPAHILGTDNLGRDVFSRLVYAVREDISLGLLTVAIMVVIAVGWAFLAAYVRRRDDWQGDTMEDMVMLPRDVLSAFPWLVMLLLVASLIGLPTSGSVTFSRYILPVILATSLVLLPRAVSIMQETFHSAPPGWSWLRSMIVTIPVMILFAVAGSILYIAAIGYQGLGVPPPTPELGTFLTGPSRRYFLQAPWMVGWPPATLILLIWVWVLAGQTPLERFGYRTKSAWSKIWE
jgi:peptide/nickel transport system permease protein